MVKRRSKRKTTVLDSLLRESGHDGKIRRSARKMSAKKAESKIYGDDYGILPSDWSKVKASAIPGRYVFLHSSNVISRVRSE